MWAEPLGQERYRLANTPWFARGFDLDDVVVASPDEQQVLWVQECEQPSGRLTARVIPLPEGPLAGSCGAVLEVFTPLGIGAETAEPAFPIVALDIPADSDLAAIKGLLLAGRQDGRWDFEEGAVSEGWMAL